MWVGIVPLAETLECFSRRSMTIGVPSETLMDEYFLRVIILFGLVAREAKEVRGPGQTPASVGRGPSGFPCGKRYWHRANLILRESCPKDSDIKGQPLGATKTGPTKKRSDLVDPTRL